MAALTRAISGAVSWSAALRLLGGAEERRSSSNAVSFNACMNRARTAGRWQHAAGLVRQMWRAQLLPDTASWGVLGSALAQSRRWRQALRLLPMSDGISCSAIASALELDWRKALGTLRHMAKQQMQRDVFNYNAVLNACEKCTAWLNGLLVNQKLHEADLADVVTCNGCLSACHRGSRWILACHLLASTVDLLGFNSALAASAKRGLWVQSVELAAEMRQRRLEPDAYSHSSMVSACGDWRHALCLLRRLSLPCHNAAIAKCAEAMHWELAVRLLSQLPAPDVISYSSAMSACQRLSKWRLVLHLFAQLRRSPHLTKQRDAVCFYTALSACANAQRWRHVLDLFEDMTRAALADQVSRSAPEKFQAEVLLVVLSYASSRAVLAACEAGGQWQKVLDLMDLQSRDVVAWCALAGAYRASRKWQQVPVAFQRIGELAIHDVRRARPRLKTRPYIFARKGHVWS
ncbi:unnamed protein product [Effrenium voratum]|nr:unnamed protein product [Effrenium voratum]